MGGNTGEIQLGSEKELYHQYICHQAGTATKSKYYNYINTDVQYNIFRVLIGVLFDDT